MFPYQTTDKGVTVFIDGAPRMFAKSHSQFEAIVEAIHTGNMDLVRELTDIKQNVANRTLGRVQILDNTILVGDREVTGRLVDRILHMIAMSSQAVDGYIKFLDKMYDNLSKQTIDELYGFIESCDLPITEDGCFLAYKIVREDYTDCRTGTFDNSIGATPTMPRNEVDDRRDVLCSTGLHVCSYGYLGHYGSSTNSRVMVVKVNPAHVVSVPTDYHNAKMRTEGYEVVSEIHDWSTTQITPWFTDEYSEPEVEELPEDYEDDFEDYETFEDDSDLFLFSTDFVRPALNAIGGNELALRSYLTVLADELDDYIDWSTRIENNRVVVNINYNDGSSNFMISFPLDSEVTTTDTTDDTPKGGAKLTVDQVKEIKRLESQFKDNTVTLTEIGRRYGVHREQIARIYRGETWKHVTISS